MLEFSQFHVHTLVLELKRNERVKKGGKGGNRGEGKKGCRKESGKEGKNEKKKKKERTSHHISKQWPFLSLSAIAHQNSCLHKVIHYKDILLEFCLKYKT